MMNNTDKAKETRRLMIEIRKLVPRGKRADMDALCKLLCDGLVENREALGILPDDMTAVIAPKKPN